MCIHLLSCIPTILPVPPSAHEHTLIVFVCVFMWKNMQKMKDNDISHTLLFSAHYIREIYFICLFVYCLFLYVSTLFLGCFLFSKNGGNFKRSEWCLCHCVLFEFSNQVVQFLLFSVGTLRQCGCFGTTTHLIPTVTDNKIVDVSNWGKRQQLNIL